MYVTPKIEIFSIARDMLAAIFSRIRKLRRCAELTGKQVFMAVTMEHRRPT